MTRLLRPQHLPGASRRRARYACTVAVGLTLAMAGALSGCADLGDSFASSAFVNPAQYDLYDCDRLKSERVSVVAQANEKQALIDKAKAGVGGAIIGEAVYRNDYIALRARKKMADEAWVRNGCDAIIPPDAPPVTAPAPKPR